MEITEAELLAALAEAAPAGGVDGACTVYELARATGWHEHRVRSALRRLIEAGRVDVHRVARTTIDGRRAVVPAYTLRRS